MELLNRQAKSIRLLADQSTSSSHLALLLPWLVFIGMGIATARLLYEAWQEQTALEALGAKIRQEKALIKQKHNFVELTSHYLRTPLTLITVSIESMKGRGVDGANILTKIGQRLSLDVNGLLEQSAASPRATSRPRQKLPNLTLYMSISLSGAFVVISLAVYLLNRLDFSSFKLTSLLAELGVAALAGLVVYSVWRTKSSRKLIMAHYEALLNEQRELDQQRNQLVLDSLNNLSRPLDELNTALKPLINQPEAKSIVKGTSDLKGILGRFRIILSLQAGVMTTTSSQISLEQMLSKIAERYRDELELKKVQIRTQIDSDNLKQDALLLEFVLNSAVDNAIKYSPENGLVDIVIRQKAKYMDIFIQDQGEGVPADQLVNLFKPFSRSENVEEEFEHQGIGLSLYLSKLVVNYLGGAIKAENRSPRGFIIKLRLPVKV